jgi:hypothetical protein
VVSITARIAANRTDITVDVGFTIFVISEALTVSVVIGNPEIIRTEQN